MAALIALSACGGGSSADSGGAATTDAPAPTPAAQTTEVAVTVAEPTVEPTTTPAPATTEPATAPDVAATTTMTFEREFLTVDVQDGWDVEPGDDSPLNVRTMDQVDAGWVFDGAALDVMVAFSTGDTTISMMREPAFHSAPDLMTWTEAIRDNVAAFGEVSAIEPDDVDVVDESARFTAESAESSGLFVTGRLRDQLVLVTIETTGEPSPTIVEQVNTMLDSIQLDPGRISDLDDAVDLRFELADGFGVGVLAPASWVFDPGSGNTLRYTDALTNGVVDITMFASRGGLDEVVDLAGTLDLLTGPLVREDRVDEVSGLTYAVLWDGDPDEAASARSVA